jgi:hypothetical protein
VVLRARCERDAALALESVQAQEVTMATARRRIGILRGALVVLASGTIALAGSGVAAADATDDYPISHRILQTSCTAEQIMAAVRDVRPVYYERYMIDYNNKSPDLQQAVRDRIHWFFSMDYAGRRQYSEDTATNAFYEPLSWQWPNWAKLFFNNKGVAARSTEVCAHYPADDQGVWNW